MKLFIIVLIQIGLVGCASTGNMASFSGAKTDYQWPAEGDVAYLQLETAKKTDGFGLEPHPHTAIIYDMCESQEEGESKFGYVGDLKISRKSKYGNPAIVKVKSGTPMFLAFGLINHINGYECTTKHIFTPEKDITYTFVNSVSWSACPTKTSAVLKDSTAVPIKGIENYDSATEEQLMQLGVNLSRVPCNGLTSQVSGTP
ncbi:hypothetical protein A9Q90_01940 [Gammaproteobacteria bacterium 54_18_T64]|nr:hypothetical protein A9Q90_01940 [Gammaproteobacteria bacterium 54_18_T64]